MHTVITDKKHGSMFGNFSAVLMEEIVQTEWNGPLYPVREAPAPQKTLLLLATSGTTGRAKLVEISEMNLDYCVHSYIDKMDYGKIRDGHNTLPHCNAVLFRLRPAHSYRVPRQILSRRNDVGRFFSAALLSDRAGL